MNGAGGLAALQAPPQPSTLVLAAALAHYLDRPPAAAASRSDDILRVAIAGELTVPR